MSMKESIIAAMLAFGMSVIVCSCGKEGASNLSIEDKLEGKWWVLDREEALFDNTVVSTDKVSGIAKIYFQGANATFVFDNDDKLVVPYSIIDNEILISEPPFHQSSFKLTSNELIIETKESGDYSTLTDTEITPVFLFNGVTINAKNGVSYDMPYWKHPIFSQFEHTFYSAKRTPCKLVGVQYTGPTQKVVMEHIESFLPLEKSRNWKEGGSGNRYFIWDYSEKSFVLYSKFIGIIEVIGDYGYSIEELSDGQVCRSYEGYMYDIYTASFDYAYDTRRVCFKAE